jgi:hypothetical protein
MNMPSPRSLWMAFALTPWFPPFLLGFFAYAFLSCEQPNQSWFSFFAEAYLVGVPFGYLALLIFGIPMAKMLMKRGKMTFSYVLACSPILGAMALFTIAIDVMIDNTGTGEVAKLSDLIIPLTWGAIEGLIAGLAFSLLAGLPFFHRSFT